MDLSSKINEKMECFKEFSENIVKISALNQDGLENLYELISKMFNLNQINFDNDIIITNLRHKKSDNKGIRKC